MATRYGALLACVAIALAPRVIVADDPPDASAVELTATGTVLLPDGTPAAGAIIYSRDNYDHSVRTATADQSGAFEMQDPFLSGGLQLHATTPEGRHQGVLLVPEEAVRSAVSQSFTLKLERAKPHLVVVTSEGQPVEGAHVCVNGRVAKQVAITGNDGFAIVWIPASEPINSVVAWHPKHGVNGIDNRQHPDDRTKTALSLLPPGPHVIRLVDTQGRPVAGQTIVSSLRPADGGWIQAEDIDATRATTDENGEVHYDWFPASGLKYVSVDLLDEGWKIDRAEHDNTPDGLTVVHVRRKFLVEGRVEFPPGADARGMLITGFGFGPQPRGDIPRTRTRKDGSFSMHVPAGHGYVLGVYDREWTGMRALVILEGDDSKLVKHVAGRLQNAEETNAIYRYLPVAVTTQQQRENAEALAAMQWPRPEVGEIVLMVTDNGNEAAASVRLKCSDITVPVEQGVQFIEQHVPPTRDGRQRLDEAKSEARKSNRLVWVISGGPRCGPCFRLARWIDQHHDVLEKDLVIVELTGQLDLHTDEIKDEIGGSGHGIPFHALMSPEGEVIVTSKGPLGNIGMPDSPEGIRHFRAMLEAGRRKMTPAELDALMDSLRADE